MNKANSFGCNACLWAAQGTADERILSWLASIGCNLFAINCNGHGILHKTAQRGNTSVCDWFLNRLDDDDSLSKRLLVSLIGPDSESCVPSDLAGMEGHETLAHELASREMTLIRSVKNASDLPQWATRKPLVWTTELTWESGAGLNRINTTFHSCEESGRREADTV